MESRIVMNNDDYDQDADMTLKAHGDAVATLLQSISGLEPQEAFAFAIATCKQAFGVLPFGDGLNRLSDDAVRDLIPVVRAAETSLVILHAVLDQRKR